MVFLGLALPLMLPQRLLPTTPRQMFELTPLLLPQKEKKLKRSQIKTICFEKICWIDITWLPKIGLVHLITSQ